MITEWDNGIQELFNTRWKGKDIYKMSKEELIEFRKEVVDTAEEYNMMNLGSKTLMNAAYGASANEHFYFYNVALAGDITGECRETTKYMNALLEDFFHEQIWIRKDLQEQFNFSLDESKHDWMRQQNIWRYSDTDSLDGNSLLLIRRAGKVMKITFNELFHSNYVGGQQVFSYGDDGKEIIQSSDEVLNWTKENGLQFVPIKYIMKHKVSKARFKIKTKSGKEIIVTGDHSCVVFRNGEQFVVKAKDINKATDKILSIKTSEHEV